jgi:Right handed beta helix region
VYKRVLRAPALIALALALMAVAASAAQAKVYVSNSAPAVVKGKSCAEPAFNSVQAAIEAAGGTSIVVCPGTYTEQLEITAAAKLTAASGAGTVTLAMPATPARSESACDTKSNEAEGPLNQADEISICTGASVSITDLNVQAEVPLETCANGLNGIFVGGGGTLKASNVAVEGASTTVEAYKGCQHGLALRVGSASREEVGHAVLKDDTFTGYEKNGPTVTGTGSTMSIVNSTVTGAGPSPNIAQNGIEVAFGGQGTVKGTTVTGNECNVGVCGPEGSQGSGVLFYQAAPGSGVTRSTLGQNDMGVYYASGSATVPATPDVSITKNHFAGNRYEGIALEEGKAVLTTNTISGPGLIGIALYQFEESLSSSESSAKKITIEGQSVAIEVVSDKQPGDKPGKFVISRIIHTANGALLVNESNNFEVIFE